MAGQYSDPEHRTTWERAVKIQEQNPDKGVVVFSCEKGTEILTTDKPFIPSGAEARHLQLH